MLKFRALSSAGWVLAGLLLSGPVLTTRSLQAAPAPPLIPREVLFGNPEIVESFSVRMASSWLTWLLLKAF